MSQGETPEAPESAGDSKPAAPPKPPPKPAAPPRELPSQEQIADWYAGADCPSIDNLFNNLVVMRFDALVMQIRKEELVPQHWQILEDREVDEAEFDRLPEVGRLRVRYKDQEKSRRRTAALEAAWKELRGKQPSLWTVPDVLAAMRRLIEKKAGVDFHELLSAVRDVWADMTLPAGREQREILWAVVSFVRDKTKK